MGLSGLHFPLPPHDNENPSMMSTTRRVGVALTFDPRKTTSPTTAIPRILNGIKLDGFVLLDNPLSNCELGSSVTVTLVDPPADIVGVECHPLHNPVVF